MSKPTEVYGVFHDGMGWAQNEHGAFLFTEFPDVAERWCNSKFPGYRVVKMKPEVTYTREEWERLMGRTAR